VEISKGARVLALRLQSGLLQGQESVLAGLKMSLLYHMTVPVLKAEGVYERILYNSLFLNALKYKGN
jgi:hypothetical protein